MTDSHSLSLTEGRAAVSALWDRPPEMTAVLVLGHGAGAGMRHRFLETVVDGLHRRRIGTLRFQFPYMEAGRRRPDPPAVAVRAVVAAVEAAAGLSPGVPLYAGGKSFGGRMTSTAAAEGRIDVVRGLVFLGFPLHPPGRPGLERAEHLARVAMPMLFVQGTRDRLADLALVQQVASDLGPHAHVHVVEGGDHSFAVPQRMGRPEGDVLDGVAGAVHDWMTRAR
jgi:predicted alpha/beta-hydrolase family hydrolase